MPTLEKLCFIQAYAESPKQTIGENEHCCFCGESDNSKFRNEAHVLPEALGNKSIFTTEECDDCNNLLSSYESSLCEFLAPFLTLGGVKGKKNKVRKTGRSKTPGQIQHSEIQGKRNISVSPVEGDFDEIFASIKTGVLEHFINVNDIHFIPQNAFKALCKMGIEILPQENRKFFTRLISDISDPDSVLPFEYLDVGFSSVTMGTWPPLFCLGVFYAEALDEPDIYILVVSVGSVCFQIQLLSDENYLKKSLLEFGSFGVDMKVICQDPNSLEKEVVNYGLPLKRFNWMSVKSQPSPISKIRVEFSLVSKQGKFTPIFLT